jgi:hypothetical protein
LLLVAGVSAGLASMRALVPSIPADRIWDAFVSPQEGWSLGYAFVLGAELGHVFGIPFMAAWTPVCLIAQLTDRPPWRRLRRQPGFVACLLATIVVGFAVVHAATTLWSTGWPAAGSAPEMVFSSQLFGGFLTGVAVLSGWATMMICGTCRPRATWSDRLGRVTGAGWVAIGAIYIFTMIA